MPALRNPKHEVFAQAIVRGETGRTAYRETGFAGGDASADVAASRLLKNDKVAARIIELQERQEIASATIVSKSWIIEQMVQNYQAAKAAGQHGPANRSLELLGREFTLFVERKEIGAPGDFDDKSDEWLIEEIRRVGARGTGARSPRGTGIGAAEDQEGMLGKPNQVH